MSFSYETMSFKNILIAKSHAKEQTAFKLKTIICPVKLFYLLMKSLILDPDITYPLSQTEKPSPTLQATHGELFYKLQLKFDQAFTLHSSGGQAAP